MTEQNGNERQIAGLQKNLDWFADEIERTLDADDGDDAIAWRLMHAQTSALLHLIKKGQTNVEYKNKLGE